MEVGAAFFFFGEAFFFLGAGAGAGASFFFCVAAFVFVAAAGSGGSGGSGVSTAGGADVSEVADFGSPYLTFDLVDRFGLAAAAGGSVMVGMIHKLWQVILDHRSIDRSIDTTMHR